MTSKHMPLYDVYRRAIGFDNLPVGKVPGVEAPNPFKKGSKFWNVTAQHELLTYKPQLAARLKAMAEAKE